MTWHSFVSADIYRTALISAISIAVFLFFTFISRRNWGILISIFVLSFSIGIYRFHLSDISYPAGFESSVGQRIQFLGMVADDPAIKEKNQQLVVKISTEDEEAVILLSARLEEEYHYGDAINLKGVLEKPENFTTDQGREFDYVNYLKKDGILYVMSYPEVEIISRDNGNFIKRTLFKVKGKFLEKINLTIQPPENLLMGGLILGEKSAFSQNMRQDFVDTGTIHIIALSGYNVTIVAEWFMRLFSFLPLSFGISMGIFAILLFILMTGVSSTAVRAGIMAGLALIARATGRNYDVGRALILAGVGMIIFNPNLLVFDVSFQLSFTATVAVIFFAPKIEKRLKWITTNFGLRDVVAVTTAAYIFVLPFVLYKMGNLSLVALPANILILPFIPFTMGMGFLTAFFGLIFPIISIPLGYITYLFLHYELWVITFFASLPFASFSFPDFPLFFMTIIYAYFTYKLFGEKIKEFFKFTELP
ncbi:MAG: ComEC/Rec2 family competence protein [Minisyncoccia bacterium]